jgi:chloramphenicol 3-O phosphotransferase
MNEPGKIIIINGPSSSGKTTLALAVQKQLDIPFLRFSFDLFLDGKALPVEQINKGVFAWASMRPSVFNGIHQCLPALATAGNNLIFDTIIETKAWLDNLIQALAGLDVFLVGLNCSLAELERREIQRGNRRIGDARTDLQTVLNITSHDLELNSENPAEDNAKVLIEAWKKRWHPGAFDKMIRERTLHSTKE